MDCPVCGEPLPPRGVNPHHPFCGRRCRLVDLAKWFDEDYRIPGEQALHAAREDERE